MLKFPPPSRYDVVLRWVTGMEVIVLLADGAIAVVAPHGVDTLTVVSAICYGIGLLIAVYGLLWGRQHANVILLIVILAMFVGTSAVTLRNVFP